MMFSIVFEASIKFAEHLILWFTTYPVRRDNLRTYMS